MSFSEQEMGLVRFVIHALNNCTRSRTTGLAHSVSYSVHEEKSFFVMAVLCASVLKLICHRADPVVHLLLLKCSMDHPYVD